MKKCSKCSEVYDLVLRTPKLLPCGHTFCVVCVKSLYSGGVLMCPKDNTLFSKPITEISPNYAIIELITTARPQEILTCCNGHSLIQSSVDCVSQCAICLRPSNISRQCTLCLYEICLSCAEWLLKTEPNPFGLVCFRNHILRVTKNVEDFYNQFKSRRKDHGKFLCDGCLTKTVGNSFQCRACRVDYCEICMKQFERIMQNIEIINCGKNSNTGILKIFAPAKFCDSKLAWRPQDTEFKCSECCNFFNKSGKFLCKTCRNNFCIKCTYKKLHE